MVAYRRGLLRCRLTSKGQCEKPRLIGWQQIQVPALSFCNITADEGDPEACKFCRHETTGVETSAYCILSVTDELRYNDSVVRFF